MPATRSCESSLADFAGSFVKNVSYPFGAGLPGTLGRVSDGAVKVCREPYSQRRRHTRLR
jgi:hypothetical protein